MNNRFLTKVQRQVSEEGIVYSISCSGTTGYSYAYYELCSIPCPRFKNELKTDHRINVKPKIYKTS